jgi:pilus assembly protein CpaD
MTMNLEHLLRAAALASILIAGSCAAGGNGAGSIAEDAAVNHPIMVEPGYRELKVQFGGGADGMTTDDAIKFEAFLADYRAHGNGSLGISVPQGTASRAAISYFGERAAATGIGRDHILVSTHDTANGDQRVDVSYIAYSARTEPCGDWSENLAYSADNLTPRNFGCAVQQNIAAMVADPRDLLGPQPAGPVDTDRRAAVMDHYEKGEATQATKKTTDQGQEQSAPGSGVGN